MNAKESPGAEAAPEFQALELTAPADAPAMRKKTLSARASRVSRMLSQNGVKEFREAFALFDTDTSGCIDAAELTNVLAHIGASYSEEEVAALMWECDLDGGGSIDFDEFLSIVRRGCEEEHGLGSVAAAAEAANIATMKLLLRGMPLPSSFGFPGTDGTLWSNWVAFVKNMHPLFSAFFAHYLHPFTRTERGFVYACSVIFSWILNTYVERWYEKEEEESGANLSPAVWLVIKWTLVILYAVLIRQLVICPCITAAMLDSRSSLFSGEKDKIEASAAASRKYDQRKHLGEAILVALSFAHVGLLVYGVALAVGQSRDTNLAILYHTLIQELGAICHWFVRFAPIFLLLHPIQRYQWYHPGATWQEAAKASYGTCCTGACCMLQGGGCYCCGDYFHTEKFQAHNHAVRPYRGGGSSGWRHNGMDSKVRKAGAKAKTTTKALGKSLSKQRMLGGERGHGATRSVDAEEDIVLEEVTTDDLPGRV